MKISSLEAIGYTCEQLDPEQVTTDQTNTILQAIVGGMRSTMTDAIRKAATEALKNTVDLACDNFEKETDRVLIMNSIKESATTCKDSKAREEAFDCLVVVGELYYHLLSSHITDIFQYTTNAIKTESDDVGKKESGVEVAM